jgi:hypothetical protein
MRKIFFVLLFVLSVSLQFAQTSKPETIIEPSRGKPVIIPTRYDEHRFVAVPVTASGERLSLFTDSAGGLFLFADTVERLHLETISLPQKDANGQPIRMAALPKFKPNEAIPLPLGSREGRFYIAPRKADAPAVLSSQDDGMLGQQWFAGRVWTFDYPRKRLLWRAPGDLPKHKKENEVKLAFKMDATGKREANFARMPVEIDGETIDFLFDTGATNILSDEALKLIGDKSAANRATSFLTRSTFEKWRKRHPEWRAFDNIKTLTGNAMIEVPKIKIGGFTVGPVWFTVQPDYAFHNYMAQFMDKPTEGAIGGSALHYLRVTVDWENAIAVFEKP